MYNVFFWDERGTCIGCFCNEHVFFLNFIETNEV